MLKFLSLFIRDFCRIFLRSLAYVLVAVIASFIVSYLWSEGFATHYDATNAYVLNTIRFGSLGVWGMLCVFSAIMTVNISCQWFGEDILTNRSYHINMLPVHTWELVLSKAVAGILVTTITILVMAYNTFAVSSKIDIVNDILGIIPDFIQSEGLDFNIVSFVTLLLCCLTMLCALIMSMSFFSLSLGQLIPRGISRYVFIFICFIAILVVCLFIIVGVYSSAGIVNDFATIDTIQNIFDLGVKILKCTTNTNLWLSVFMLIGSGAILNFKLNV